MASITLKDIGKRYEHGGVFAVKDVTMKIEDEEFIVLVGPSGCGKSTTLRMIAGLEEITEGELFIGDRLVNDVEPKDRDIAMVFQNYALYPHMTVYGNMAFGLKLKKTPKDEIDRRVKEAAGILGITSYLDRKPKALSGGQRQRVALGRAIVRKPSVFLMDEPLSNLDAKLRVTMRAELLKLHRRLKTTFVYVTHDQTEAMTMGTRIVVMKDGFIQQIDTPSRLYRNPANLFVAQFIGSPQMSLWRGTLERRAGKVFASMWGRETAVDGSRSDLIEESAFGREVIFGIRPEDIEKSDADGFEMEVEVAEQTGADLFLIAIPCGAGGKGSYRFGGDGPDEADQDNKGAKINVRIAGSYVMQPGERIRLRLNTGNLHVFDPETGKSLLKPG
jgi:multiple sugar transport system ATP-binding protein